MSAEQIIPQIRPKRRFSFRINVAAFFPHYDLDADSQALYAYEARNLRYGKTLESLLDMTLRWLGIAALLTGAWWLVIVASNDYTGAQGILGNITNFLLVISLADKFVYDFIGLASGLDSVRTEFTQHRWPLIAVSDLSMRRWVAVKYIVVQISAWRTMLLVMCLRLSVVVLVLLRFFLMPIVYNRGSIFELAGLTTEELVFSIAFVTIFIIVGIVLVFEPRWRLRSLSAASMYNSMRGRDASVGLMWSVPSFLSLWGTQIMITIGSIFGFQFPFAVAGMLGFDHEGVLALLYVVYVLGIAAIIRSNYRGFARTRVNKVYRRLVQEGGSK